MTPQQHARASIRAKALVALERDHGCDGRAVNLFVSGRQDDDFPNRMLTLVFIE